MNGTSLFSPDKYRRLAFTSTSCPGLTEAMDGMLTVVGILIGSKSSLASGSNWILELISTLFVFAVVSMLNFLILIGLFWSLNVLKLLCFAAEKHTPLTTSVCV